MSKPSQPAQPDPVQVAKAQEGTNVGTAVAQAGLNDVNTVGPGGTTTYNQTGGYTDPQSGQWVPQYTETTNLSPLGNQLLQGQQNLTNTYMPMLQNEAQNVQPFNPNAGTNAGIVNAGPQALDQNVSNAVYNEQAGFLNPQWAQNKQNLNDQLSQQGIPVGSPAWNDAMTNFNNSQTQAYQAASNNAVSQGAGVAGQNFGLALQGQNANTQNQLLSEANPIGLLSYLTSGASLGGSA